MRTLLALLFAWFVASVVMAPLLGSFLAGADRRSEP